MNGAETANMLTELEALLKTKGLTIRRQICTDKSTIFVLSGRPRESLAGELETKLGGGWAIDGNEVVAYHLQRD